MMEGSPTICIDYQNVIRCLFFIKFTNFYLLHCSPITIMTKLMLLDILSARVTDMIDITVHLPGTLFNN